MQTSAFTPLRTKAGHRLSIQPRRSKRAKNVFDVGPSRRISIFGFIARAISSSSSAVHSPAFAVSRTMTRYSPREGGSTCRCVNTLGSVKAKSEPTACDQPLPLLGDYSLLLLTNFVTHIVEPGTQPIEQRL